MRLRILTAFVAAAAFCAIGAAPVSAQTGYMAISSSHLTDFSGSAINNATITWAPTNNAGQPISAHIGSSGGGQGITSALTVNVASGAFSVTVADTVLTSPANVCYNVTVIDNSTGNILLNYPCVQPGSTGQTSWCTTTTCNFDAYTPPIPANTTIATGPQGPQGPAGPNCSVGSPTGWCDLTNAVEVGTTLNFNIASLAQLNTAITACSSSFCAFHIAGTVSFTTSLSIPALSVVSFEGGQFAGTGTINMNGSTIMAPSTTVITGSIVLTNLSRVDPAWWGGRTSSAGFLAAIASLTGGGTAALGLGTYAAPGTTNTANLQIIGSGMPTYNSGYTALSGGTILQGSLGIEGNYNVVENLGVDVGSALEGATCLDGLGINNSLTPGSTAIQRPIVRDVAVLLNGTCPNHGILVENTNFANLEHVKSAMGFYGLVLKSNNATARDVWTCGNSSTSIYVKADSAFSGSISNILLDGFTVDNSCGTTPTSVLVEAQTASIAGITLDHGLVVANSGNALNIEGDGSSFTVTDWNVDHFKSVNSGGAGIFFTANTARGTIDHAFINSPSGVGMISSGASFPLNINNSIVTNSPTGGFNIASVSDGNVEISNSQVLGSTTPYGITVTAGVVNLVNFSAINGVTAVCVSSGGTCSGLTAVPTLYSNGSLITAPPIIQTFQVSMSSGTVTQALSAFTATPICGAMLVTGGASVGTADPTVWVSAVSSSSVTINASSSGYSNGVNIVCIGH